MTKSDTIVIEGGKRAFRILQKRGKIIDAEDFIPLQETYPKHPLSFKEPKNGIKTLSELKEYRTRKTKEEINTEMKKKIISLKKNQKHQIF